MDDVNRSVAYFCDRYGRRPPDTTGTGASWIQHAYAAHEVVTRHVGVTVHDHGGPGGNVRKPIQFCDAMAMCKRESHAIKLQFGPVDRVGPDVESVRVAPYGCDRRDRCQICEDAGKPDIARVENSIDPAKVIEHLGTQNSVRVADQSDAQPSVSRWPIAAESGAW